MKRYAALAIICCGSILVALLLRQIGLSFLSELAAFPSIGALVAALYQVARDQASHERAMQLQSQSQAFQFVAMSHMSKVCFDKYVEFAEAYYAEAQKVLAELFREGPTIDTGRNQAELYDLRRKFRLWLTEDLVAELDRFQDGLQQIGMKMRLADAEADQARKDALWIEAHDDFARALGLQQDGGAGMGEKQVVVLLRNILGASALTEMRQAQIEKARDQALA